MSRRMTFGGADDLDPDGDYGDHPSLVQLSEGEHSAHNEEFYHYAGGGGGVAFAQNMSERVQRNLTYNAMYDMQEEMLRDGVPRRGRPGAMGSLWAEGALRRGDNGEDGGGDGGGGDFEAQEEDIRRGHQLFLGSSMRRRRDLTEEGEYQVALGSNLWEQLADVGDGELPDHRRDWNCAEPGMFSEHEHANSWDGQTGHVFDGGAGTEEGYQQAEAEAPEFEGDLYADGGEDGGRVYVVDHEGQHMAPCGDDSCYGCRNLCEQVGAYDLGEGDGHGYDAYGGYVGSE
jgi:hypothetical protein